jgi:hypothetical protein
VGSCGISYKNFIGLQRSKPNVDVGQSRGVGCKSCAQAAEIGQFALTHNLFECLGKFGFTAAFMSEREKIDGDPAGLPFRQSIRQNVKYLPERLAWKELITIDEIFERHGLLAQGVNNVAVVDDLAAFARGWWASAR